MTVKKAKPELEKVESEQLTVQDKSTNQQSEIDILREQNKALQEQMAEQMKMMASLMSQQSNNQPSQNTAHNEVNRMVKVVHLSNPSAPLTTPIELSNRKFDFRFFGEEKFLRFDEFQELASKYKRWFELNILALGSEESDLVERFDLICADDVALTSYHIKNLGNLTFEELEDLYKKVSDNHRLLITRMWAYGYYDLKEDGYKDRRKVDMLNDFSGGAMENILAEIDEARKRK